MVTATCVVVIAVAAYATIAVRNVCMKAHKLMDRMTEKLPTAQAAPIQMRPRRAGSVR